MTSVKDVEGEESIQGNTPPPLNDQPNLKTFKSLFTQQDKVHLHELSYLLTNKLSI
jgi:hypothetical protein